MTLGNKSPLRGGATYPLKNRLFRGLWQLVWRFTAQWTPTPFFRWRKFVASVFGAKLAATAKIYPGVSIWNPANLQMEDFSCLGPGVICYSMDKIRLGRYAIVSQRSHLCAGTHDIDDPQFTLLTGAIEIRDHAWVAAEAFLGPGVIVEDGAVLGARSLAMRRLEAWQVYAGVPAKKIRARKKNV